MAQDQFTLHHWRHWHWRWARLAQISVAGGFKVKIFDSEGRGQRAEEFIHRMIKRSAEKGQINEIEAEAANAHPKHRRKLSDFADCSLVIEAIVENLDVKRGFSELEGVVAEDTILASIHHRFRLHRSRRAENQTESLGLTISIPCHC